MSGNYYGMSFNPFDKYMATKDVFLTLDMKEMNGRLDYLKNNPGIGVFTAGAGQGKTSSLHCFSSKLNPDITKFTYICLSTITATEFYRQLCSSLGLDAGHKKSVMFKSIQEYFENNPGIHMDLTPTITVNVPGLGLDEADYICDCILILNFRKLLIKFSIYREEALKEAVPIEIFPSSHIGRYR